MQDDRQSGDPPPADSFALLFTDHYGAVLWYLRRRMSDNALAEDLADECFAIAWQKFDVNRPIDLPWLYQTAAYLLANERRRAARERDIVGWLGEQINPRREPDDVIEVRAALDRMSEEDRELLILFYWEGLTGSEIARVLRITEGAVRVRLTRARTRMKNELGASLDAAEAMTRRLADDLG